MLKRITGKSHLAYRYGFNIQNRLVIAEQLDDYSLKEVLIYEKHLVTGISFNEDGQIRRLSECEYKDGKIKTYICGTAISLKDQNIVNEYSREEYHYSDDCLDFVHRFAYTYHKSMPILEHSKYEFQHDEEGYLSQYYIKKYEGNKEKEGFWDGHPFKVYLKRKADICENPVILPEKSLKKRADRGINLAQIIFDQLKPVIEQWKKPDIYAVSFYVEDDMDCPTVTVSYNTMSDYQKSKEICPDEQAEKWDYASWPQSEEYVFGCDDTADIMSEWVVENQFNDIKEHAQYNEQDGYTIPEYLATREVVKQLVIVAQKLHKEQVIQKVLHKAIPIIIHDLEYSPAFLAYTEEANPEGLADEFLDWVNSV